MSLRSAHANGRSVCWAIVEKGEEHEAYVAAESDEHIMAFMLRMILIDALELA